jgi:hypothetical protein
MVTDPVDRVIPVSVGRLLANMSVRRASKLIGHTDSSTLPQGAADRPRSATDSTR